MTVQQTEAPPGSARAVLDGLADQAMTGIPAAATVLGIDRRTVLAAIRSGDIPATFIAGRWRIPVAWLREACGGR